jgi:two-component system response regulator
MKHGKSVILIVEDDSDDLELLRHTFEEVGIANFIVATDGQEALDYLFSRGSHVGREAIPPQLVLLDLKLPKIGGLDVLRTIKADPCTKSIPVVILASSREERDLIAGYQLGANSYIQKPIDFTQFQKSVRAIGHYWLVVNNPSPPDLKPCTGASQT